MVDARFMPLTISLFGVEANLKLNDGARLELPDFNRARRSGDILDKLNCVILARGI